MNNAFVVHALMEDLMLANVIPPELAFEVKNSEAKDAATGEDYLTAGENTGGVEEPADRKAARLRALNHIPSLCSKMGEQWVAHEAVPYLLRCIREEERALSLAVADVLPALCAVNRITPSRVLEYEVAGVLLQELCSSPDPSVRSHVVSKTFEAIFVPKPAPFTKADPAAEETRLAVFGNTIMGLLESRWTTQRGCGAHLVGTFLREVASHSQALRRAAVGVLSEFKTRFLEIDESNPGALSLQRSLDPVEVIGVLGALPTIIDWDAYVRGSTAPGETFISPEVGLSIIRCALRDGIAAGVERLRFHRWQATKTSIRPFGMNVAADESVYRELIACMKSILTAAATALAAQRSTYAESERLGGGKANSQAPPRPAECESLLEIIIDTMRPLISLACEHPPTDSLASPSRSTDWKFRFILAEALPVFVELLLVLAGELLIRSETRTLRKTGFVVDVVLCRAFVSLAQDVEEEVRIAVGCTVPQLLQPLLQHVGAKSADSNVFAAQRRAVIQAAVLQCASSQQQGASSLIPQALDIIINHCQMGIMDESERVRSSRAGTMAAVARGIASWRGELRALGAADPSSAFSSEQTRLLSVMADLLHDDSHMVQLEAIGVLADFIAAFGLDVVANELTSLTERLLQNPLWRIRATLGIVLPNIVAAFLHIIAEGKGSDGGPDVSRSQIIQFVKAKLVPLMITILLDRVQGVRDVALKHLQTHVLTGPPAEVGPFLNELLWPALMDAPAGQRSYIMRVALVNAAVVLADPPPLTVNADAHTGPSVSPSRTRFTPPAPTIQREAIGLEMDRHVIPLLQAAAGDTITNVRMRVARGIWQLLVPHKLMLGEVEMRHDPISTTRGHHAQAARRDEGKRSSRLSPSQRETTLLPLLRRLIEDEDKDVREAAAAALAECT